MKLTSLLTISVFVNLVASSDIISLASFPPAWSAEVHYYSWINQALGPGQVVINTSAHFWNDVDHGFGRFHFDDPNADIYFDGDTNIAAGRRKNLAGQEMCCLMNQNAYFRPPPILKWIPWIPPLDLNSEIVKKYHEEGKCTKEGEVLFGGSAKGRVRPLGLKKITMVEVDIQACVKDYNTPVFISSQMSALDQLFTIQEFTITFHNFNQTHPDHSIMTPPEWCTDDSSSNLCHTKTDDVAFHLAFLSEFFEENL
eukprot:TRINITY_DN8345_c0_g1_i1.p1 TRINITY_DN8345_c0_g1~~TRINITY_DN8345_c0_g1_i1.p1  ORF type:complete len:255 (-),score=41.84 TRINITY_DN8345_c0_g1_i1:165-929(-)